MDPGSIFGVDIAPPPRVYGTPPRYVTVSDGGEMVHVTKITIINESLISVLFARGDNLDTIICDTEAIPSQPRIDLKKLSYIGVEGVNQEAQGP